MKTRSFINGLKKSAVILLLIFNTSNKAISSVQSADINIHQAVMSNNIKDVKAYIAAKKDINLKDPMGGSSPLITAALFGRTEIAKLLIEAGANINQINNDGSTALHTSALFCHTDIVKMLLQKGANKTIKNKYGSTAYNTVAGTYASMKPVYEMMEKMLGPIGLKLDYAHLEKTRPMIANLLK